MFQKFEITLKMSQFFLLYRELFKKIVLFKRVKMYFIQKTMQIKFQKSLFCVIYIFEIKIYSKSINFRHG